MEPEYFETGTDDKTLQAVTEKEKVCDQLAPNSISGRTFRSLKNRKNRIGNDNYSCVCRTDNVYHGRMTSAYGIIHKIGVFHSFWILIGGRL